MTSPRESSAKHSGELTKPQSVTFSHQSGKESLVDDENFMKKQKRRMSESAVVNKIHTARHSSNTKVGYFRRLVILVSTSTCFTILMTMFMFIPLTKIIIGAIFFNQCPVEPMIPLYLVIGGTVACVRDIANLCMRSTLSDADYMAYEVVIVVVAFVYTLAEFVWFVFGSVYVYKTLHIYQWKNTKADDYCSLTLYMYAFVITTISYFFLLMSVSISLVTICLAHCLEDPIPEKQPETTTIMIIHKS